MNLEEIEHVRWQSRKRKALNRAAVFSGVFLAGRVQFGSKPRGSATEAQEETSVDYPEETINPEDVPF